MSHDSTPHERTEALAHHLEEHGHVHHVDVDAAIVAREMAFESGDGPSPALGAKIVARAWTDPEFKARLVDDGTATLSEYTPMTVPVAVMENTPDVHHMIVCTLCSCYPGAVLGDPPAWYKSFEYRSRVVREPRAVLAEFGMELGDDVEVRVVDSTSEQRFMVLPVRPEGTEGWARARVYRGLLYLYPREFREHYRDDLEQAITDLSAELGRRRALSRVALDLAVTVPRYRIEALMKEEHTATVLTVAITAMACIGIVSIFTSLYLGAVLLVLAVVLAVTQRSSLARSTDPVNGTRLRHKRLMTAKVLGVLLPVIYLVSLPILGDDWGTDAVVAFGVWFLVLIGAVVYLITGLNTPKSHTA